MKPVSAAEMRRLDRAAIEDFGIPSLLLMENAGRGVCELILRDHRPCRTAIFIGKGNNGGDGLVVARHLANRGFQVRILMLEDPASLKSDPLANFRIVEKMKLPFQKVTDDLSEEVLLSLFSDAELIVDALLGTGLKSDLQGRYKTAVIAIHNAFKPVVSIDVPSGLDADSGMVHGVAVAASMTATLGLPKAGLFTGAGPRNSGKIEIVDIGIPRVLLEPYLD